MALLVCGVWCVMLCWVCDGGGFDVFFDDAGVALATCRACTKFSGPTPGMTPGVGATGPRRPSGRRPKNCRIPAAKTHSRLGTTTSAHAERQPSSPGSCCAAANTRDHRNSVHRSTYFQASSQRVRHRHGVLSRNPHVPEHASVHNRHLRLAVWRQRPENVYSNMMFWSPASTVFRGRVLRSCDAPKKKPLKARHSHP